MSFSGRFPSAFLIFIVYLYNLVNELIEKLLPYSLGPLLPCSEFVCNENILLWYFVEGVIPLVSLLLSLHSFAISAQIRQIAVKKSSFATAPLDALFLRSFTFQLICPLYFIERPFLLSHYYHFYCQSHYLCEEISVFVLAASISCEDP